MRIKAKDYPSVPALHAAAQAIPEAVWQPDFKGTDQHPCLTSAYAPPCRPMPMPVPLPRPLSQPAPPVSIPLIQPLTLPLPAIATAVTSQAT